MLLKLVSALAQGDLFYSHMTRGPVPAPGCSRYLLLAAAGGLCWWRMLSSKASTTAVEVLRPNGTRTGLSLVTPAKPDRGEFYQFKKKLNNER